MALIHMKNLMENNKVYREICEVQMQGGGDFDRIGRIVRIGRKT